jgi:hypothetical protein
LGGVLLFSIEALASSSDLQLYKISIEQKEVSGSSIKEITSDAHYSQKTDEVWKMINRYIDFPKFIPRMKECELLAKEKDREQVYFKFSLPLFLPDLWNIIYLWRNEEGKTLRWQMHKGNMEFNEGDLRVFNEGKGSKISLHLKIDLGHGYPDFLVKWGTKNFVPKVLKSIGDQLSGKPMVSR